MNNGENRMSLRRKLKKCELVTFGKKLSSFLIYLTCFYSDSFQIWRLIRAKNYQKLRVFVF